VTVDTDQLVHDVTAALGAVQIRLPRVTVTKGRVDVSTEGAFVAQQMSGARTMVDLAGRYPLPNLIDLMADLMQYTSPPVRLTRRTLLRILREAPTQAQGAMVDNPTEFATVAVGIIKDKVARQLVDGIQYEKINEWYEMTQFEMEFESWQDKLAPSRRANGSDGSGLYDAVPWESEVERRFVEGLEQRDDVKLYIKLPDWFVVDTPIGVYNPDWAVVMEDPESSEPRPLLYLVRETKSTTRPEEWRPDETQKVACGEKHFGEALKVNYKVATAASELP
jgi:type III restriction enzyme